MTDEAKDANPAEQLVELLLYAPVGLLYEYQEVLPQLIKRGKSQVQLAKVLGQMAANRGQAAPGAAASEIFGVASTILARLVTDLGSQIGLAPQGSGPTDAPAPSQQATDSDDDGVDVPRPPPAKTATVTESAKPLPIARYDELTAREIIPLLDDLKAEQRGRVRVHEAANRNRKTVLAKLDRLEP